MTDRPSPMPPVDPDFELVSSCVDGEATPDEAARVEADPVLVARAADLRALAERLSVSAPPVDMLERHLAVALAEFSTEPSGDGDGELGETTTATVTPLARQARRPRIPLGAVAAAAVVLALVGAFATIDFGDGDGADTASAPTAEDLSTFDADTGSGGSGQDDRVAASELAPDAALPATGGADARPSFATTDELADFVIAREQADTAGSGAPPEADAPQGGSADGGAAGDDAAANESAEARPFDPCDAISVAGIEPAIVQELFGAVVDGRDVTAVISDAEEGRRLVVVDDASCTVVDDRRV